VNCTSAEDAERTEPVAASRERHEERRAVTIEAEMRKLLEKHKLSP
jgi:hypothetical protein